MKATNGVLQELGQNCRSHWITSRHRYKVEFAAELGGGEPPKLIREVFMNVDHEVLLTAFQFVLFTFQED